MRTLTPLLLGLILLLFSSSCATITRGSTDDVIVRTYPPGAEVTLSNGMTGLSPASFEVPRKQSLVVSICKAGFKPIQVTLNPVISSEGGVGMAGNILAGGLIGAAVDAGSGAMYDLTPNPLEVTLIPLESVEEYDPHQFMQDVIESFDEEDSMDMYEDYDPMDSGYAMDLPEAHEGFGNGQPHDPYGNQSNPAMLPNDPYGPNPQPYGQDDPYTQRTNPDVPIGPGPNEPVEPEGMEIPDTQIANPPAVQAPATTSLMEQLQKRRAAAQQGPPNR